MRLLGHAFRIFVREAFIAWAGAERWGRTKFKQQERYPAALPTLIERPKSATKYDIRYEPAPNLCGWGV
ncbi:MAG: hypothetical protein WA581_10465, partial [Candidatus Acidiferrales bacterium]